MENRPRPRPFLYDLFCKAGGTSRGYQQAGFYVVGVDNKPQPRYIGDEFIQMDALEFLRRLLAGEYPRPVMISASPPCQRYSKQTRPDCRGNHPDLIAPTRALLERGDVPFIIENVEEARGKLINPVKLCGSMFGLPIRRHRYFEMSPNLFFLTPPCQHDFLAVYITGTPKGRGPRKDPSAKAKREAMQTPWMTVKEMDEAIPPAYTAWLGCQMLAAISS